jgi:hypothetical protein
MCEIMIVRLTIFYKSFEPKNSFNVHSKSRGGGITQNPSVNQFAR